MDMKGNT